MFAEIAKGDQFKDVTNAIRLLNEANQNGMIGAQYQNPTDLAEIANVIYAGENYSGRKEIYDLGIKIYNKFMESQSLQKPKQSAAPAATTNVVPNSQPANLNLNQGGTGGNGATPINNGNN